MDKKVKIIATALLVTGSLLSVIPANAATKSNIAKPSGDIAVASVSNHRPPNGFSGRLWCTGNGVYVRDQYGKKIPDIGGGYVVMNRGNSFYFDNVIGDRAYFTTLTGGTAYVSTEYLSTIEC
ncbi:MAG: hypothetical protein ACLU7E_04870 [Clostridium butyricum]